MTLSQISESSEITGHTVTQHWSAPRTHGDSRLTLTAVVTLAGASAAQRNPPLPDQLS